MYADIPLGCFKIKKGVIINKTHVVVSPQQLILCTRFDKKSGEFICEQKMYESRLKCECMEDLTEHHVLCERDML